MLTFYQQRVLKFIDLLMKFISIMLYIRTLLSPRSRSTQEAYVSDLLSSTGVRGNGELKE